MSSHSPSQKTPAIHLFSEDLEFELKNAANTIQWILDAYQREDKKVAALNYIFCSDNYLHQLNIQYLNHDTLTDVITFPNSRKGEDIEGDIFISIDRIAENATAFNVSFNKELLRVMIHGSLHLMGYLDKTPEDQKVMSEKEDFYLRLFEEA